MPFESKKQKNNQIDYIASGMSNAKNNHAELKEVAVSCLKLGCIGFGGIAGMVSTIENEMVNRRKWIDHQHFMDVVSTSYIIPGPNAVEIVMHCGKERAGKWGLIVAGICYILPAMLICLIFGYFYKRYSELPDVQHMLFGLRPAIAALVISTVFKLYQSTLKGNIGLILIALGIFVGAFLGINEVALILVAGLLNVFISSSKNQLSVFTGFIAIPLLAKADDNFYIEKMFLIFLKIGAILYGSGYVLFAYMDESLVRNHHWLTRQQLMDAIAVGQFTPGPILSSATFAGYLMHGITGGIAATIGIFLPSFFISFFLHAMLSKARKIEKLRVFLNGLSAASIAIIAVVSWHLFDSAVNSWQAIVVFVVSLLFVLFPKKINTVLVILIGSVLGFLLLKIG